VVSLIASLLLLAMQIFSRTVALHSLLETAFISGHWNLALCFSRSAGQEGGSLPAAALLSPPLRETLSGSASEQARARPQSHSESASRTSLKLKCSPAMQRLGAHEHP
jgi:hypothetical protein